METPVGDSFCAASCPDPYCQQPAADICVWPSFGRERASIVCPRQPVFAENILQDFETKLLEMSLMVPGPHSAANVRYQQVLGVLAAVGREDRALLARSVREAPALLAVRHRPSDSGRDLGDRLRERRRLSGGRAARLRQRRRRRSAPHPSVIARVRGDRLRAVLTRRFAG